VLIPNGTAILAVAALLILLGIVLAVSTIVAQSGRANTQPPVVTPTPTRADRLRELDDLRSQGLVTEEEYAARRQAIIESI